MSANLIRFLLLCSLTAANISKILAILQFFSLVLKNSSAFMCLKGHKSKSMIKKGTTCRKFPFTKLFNK